MKRLWIYMSIIMPFLILPACSHEDDSHMDVVSRLQDVSRLELARMTVGKVGVIADPTPEEAVTIAGKANAFYNRLKIGTRIGVYSYDTYIVAYVDLGKLTENDVEVDEESKKIRITLPPVEVMTDGREPLLHEEHSRITGLRSAITPAERAALKAQMAREVKKELENPSAAWQLREAAMSKGRIWLSELVSDWGYSADISFRE